MPNTKICTKCKVEKPVVEFHKNKSFKDGLQYKCKACVAADYQENQEERRAKQTVYNQGHKEERAVYNREHKEQIAAKDKVRYQENREERRAKDKVYRLEHREEKAAYRKEHKEERAAYNKVYRREHKEEQAAYRLEHREEKAAYDREHKEEINVRKRERRRTDPNFILKEFCQGQVKRMLNGNSKDHSSDEYLGCTREEGRKYIESLWEPGMAWENHGEWHIHHIEKISSFNPEDPTAIFWACNISNLQPLWVDEHKQVHSSTNR